jgi:hypothetical protein
MISSASCGSGKTRLIRRKLDKIRKKDNEAEVASLVVHEGTTLSSLITVLDSKFQNSRPYHAALHVSFSVLQIGGKRSDDWIRQLNFFFFSLLVLRSVYDPVSSRSFSLGDKQWKLFFELPQSEAEETSSDWLTKNIPVLTVCGTAQSPSAQYVIDEKARRVSTYLRALSTGTINRKFCSGSQKRIVLALDCSGSMRACFSNGLTAFQVAVNNAVGIVDSHLVEGDVSMNSPKVKMNYVVLPLIGFVLLF